MQKKVTADEEEVWRGTRMAQREAEASGLCSGMPAIPQPVPTRPSWAHPPTRKGEINTSPSD